MKASLASVKAKIQRSEEHFKSFMADIRAFGNDKPYEVLIQDDPETGGKMASLRVLKDAPVERWGLFVGDIVHNLRSALDHLAWQLVILNGRKPHRGTAFPICLDPQVYICSGIRKIERMAPKATTLIERLQPYYAGTAAKTHPLWLLQRLDNRDKHQVLNVLAVGASPTVTSIEFSGLPLLPEIDRVMMSLPPERPRYIPFIDGAKIMSVSPSEGGGSVNVNAHVSLEVVLDEPRVIEVQSVVPFIQRLGDFVVGNAIRNFESMFL